MPFLPVLAMTLLVGHGDLYRHSGYSVSGKPWFDAGMTRAKEEGLLTGYSREALPTDKPSLMSRYECAVVFHATLTNQLNLIDDAAKSQGAEARRRMVRAASLLAFYRKASVEYRKELDSLGVPEEMGIDRLSLAVRRARAHVAGEPGPFRDVPADHWAAKAVGDLRALGLLDGYPDGSFRG